MELLRNRAELETACIHCGKTSSTRFCCAGCEAVHAILQDSGLGQYYARKKDGVCFKSPEPARVSGRTYDSWDTRAERDVELFVEGVHCSACLWLLEKVAELESDQVETARLDLSRSVLRIRLRPNGKISPVAMRLDSWGYTPHLIETAGQVDAKIRQANRKQLIELGLAGALAGNVMLMSIPLYAGVEGGHATLFAWLSGILSVPSFFYSGRSLFLNVYRSARTRSFSIDIPVSLAIAVAFFYSWAKLIQGSTDLYFDSLTALIFLLLASRYWLSRLRELGLGHGLSMATRGGDSAEKTGEIVSFSGEREIPFDGVIRQGTGWVSQAFLTGESEPILMRTGDEVFAGSQFLAVGDSLPVSIEVVRTGEQTRLARMLEQVRSGTDQRSRVERAYDSWAKRLLAFVTITAFFVAIYWLKQGRADIAVERALALLIVTCPCALALAAPLVVSLAIRRAFRNGLVIRDIDVFERARSIRQVYFDKTGTLTTGTLEVISAEVQPGKKEILKALARTSRHPVARAIDFYFSKTVPARLESHSEMPGIGVRGVANGKVYTLVRGPRGTSFQENGQEIGAIELSDAIRLESVSTVMDLRQRGLHVGILSGDRSENVRDVVARLGLENDARIGSALSPEDKQVRVIADESSGRPVLFVGDGVNDSLAMKSATASIALHGGMEEALKSASIYSMKPGLESVPTFFLISDQVGRSLRVCFISSTLYNVVGGSLAVLGYMNPLWAAVLMPLSATTAFAFAIFADRKGSR